MHYISDQDKSDADAVIIAKKWAKEELTIEQIFPVEFQSILISSMHGTVGKASMFILKMEIQCLKLLMSTLVNLNGKESHSASTEMILELVEIDQWTPMEAVNLLKALSLKCTEDVSVAKVLKLVEVYDISPSWTDDSGHSLIQALDNANSESFYQDFHKILKKRDESNLDAVLANIKMSQKLDDSRIKEIREVISGVFQFSENAPKGPINFKTFDTKNLQNCLSQLCKAVFDAKSWWPTVKHMVQWCVLVLTGKTNIPQLVSSEDPCVIALFAAAQFYMGNKMDIMLNSDNDTETQVKEWSDFYKNLGISVRTNIRKQTDTSFMTIYEADVIYGTLQDFLSDYFMYWKEVIETQIPHLRRGFIIEEECLLASQTPDLSRLKDSESLACSAEALQDLMGRLQSENMGDRERFIKAIFQALHSNLKESPSTEAKIVKIFKKISGKEILPKDMFCLTFLENLLKVVTSENEGGKIMTSTAETWCFESILASSEQIRASSKDTTEVFQMVSNLGDKHLWSPLELLNLLGALINHHHGEGCISIMKILHLLETYRVSSKWTDEKKQSVISLLESCKTENLIQNLGKSLGDEKIKNIGSLIDEIRQMEDIDEETLNKSYKIVAHVTELIEKEEIKKHNDIKKAKQLSHSTEIADLQEVLAVLCNAVSDDKKYFPRATQMISWCLLALSNTGKLLEMGTGEGKSCVIAMFAALRVFRGEKVDVVSSSSVLCQRDAAEWENFYKAFGITVDSNTNKIDDSSRKECYQKDIIYGTIETFAADHLRQIFEMKDVRPDRSYECIIIDEVDSLLLDQGVQLTYLSSPLVCMEHLNTILAMIWGHVQQYGFLMSEHQTFVQGPPASFFRAIFDSINTEESEINDPLDILRIAEETKTVPEGFTEDIHKGDKNDIVKKLKIVSQDAVINFFEEMEEYVPYGFTVYTLNDEGLLCPRKLSPYNTNQIPDLKFLVLGEGLCCPLYDSEEVLIKPIAELISEKIQYTPCTDNTDKISIPGFLRNLIETKMSLWVENAFLAKQLKEGRDYVVENENVCPVDFRSTGIIEMNKKWGDGLQQFVEIKHQVKLSTISAVTNYISNISFFQKYHGKIYGTTGTLGTEKDILFLQDLYPSLSACRMPTFNRKKLYEVKGTLKKTSKEWKSEIKGVVMSQISSNLYREGRAALVICETINRAKEIYEELKSSIKGEIILYSRSDKESLSKIDKELESGDVIVATNLAGRGTDIKVSKKVNNNGGLFVILSFLSENTRVELQAFGRTARKGKPGSAQIIACTEHLQHDFRSATSLEEAKSTRDRLAAEKISSMMNDVSEMNLREELFSEYCETLHDIYKKTDGDDRKVIVAIMNEYWGIWLQIKSEDIEQRKKSELQQSLKKDLSVAREQSSSQTSPCSSIYHYINFGNISLDDKKWENSARLFDKAMNQDKSWAAIAFYSHAYCTIKLSKGDYLTQAKEDLLKAQESLKYLNEECIVCLQFIKMATVDSGKGEPSSLEKQITSKCSMYRFFDKNITEAIQKIDEIKGKGRDAIAKKSPVFSLVSDADEALQLEADNLYRRGLKYVFSVEEKPRFCWEGLVVFLLGVLQIVAGALLTVFTVGTLAQIGMGLITEGISDCIEGITAMVTGEFSWKEWAIGKAISIGVSIISFGVGKLISKGFKAAKAAFKAIGKKLKSLPKFLSKQAKQSLSTVTKTNMKNALKHTVKTIAEETLFYGLEKAEEKVLDEILKGIKNDVTKGVVKDVKTNLEKEPLATLVDNVALLDLLYKEQLRLVLEDKDRKKDLLSIYKQLGDSALQPLYADLSWQNKLNSSIIKVLDSATEGTKGKTRAILTGIQVTHHVILAGDAIGEVLTLSSKFFSNFEKELNTFIKEKPLKVKRNELTFSETDMLKIFKQDLAETLSSLLADALVEVFYQKFFSHLVSRAQNEAHEAIRRHVKSGLKSERTEEKLKAGQLNNYIVNMPVNPNAKLSANAGRLARSHAEKIKDNKAAGTILDIRVLSEATGTRVVILSENKQGKLTKMQEVSPSTKSASETVTLIYRPKSTQNPNGHYDVFIDNKAVSIDSKQQSSLFHAMARGMKPKASDSEIASEANRLRSVEANMLLKQSGQWEPFMKRKELTETIRGGDWYMAEAGRPERIIKENKTLLQKITGKIEQYKGYLKKPAIPAVEKTVNANQQPSNSTIVEANKLNQKSKLAVAMLQARKYLSGSDTSKTSGVEKQEGLKLPTDRNLKDVVEDISSPEPKALKSCLASMISKDDVVGTFKLMTFSAMLRCQLTDTKNVQNKKKSKTRVAMFEKSFQENSTQMVQKWYSLLQDKGVMTNDHQTTIIQWINTQGYKDRNDPHRKQVSSVLS
ncbi:uncharacterized protein LOC106947176 [Poecilia latipinna]|nr:PREDICTED: uncharacterized protein LOC106947176 [Poecilia latipinna]